MSKLLRSLLTIEHVLLLWLLALVGVAAESLTTGSSHAALWLLAVGGGMLGIVLGTLRTVDSLAHLVAIMPGAAGTVTVTAYRRLPAQDELSFWGSVRRVTDELKEWYLGTTPQGELEALLVMILLQMIVWLVAYLAAWSLVRQRWLTVSLVLPAILLLASLLFGSGGRETLLELYLIGAIVLMARVTYVRRQQSQRNSSARPVSNIAAWGSLLPAFVVALLVVGTGTATPADFSRNTIRPVANYAGEQYLDAQERAFEWMDGQFAMSGPGPVSLDAFPRYTAFDDAFSIGGDLNLSDRPEVLVRTEAQAPYLSAQSYDRYTGRGWKSTVEETFQAERPNGVRYSPELNFRPGQEMPYSFAERRPVPMEVTPLNRSGDTMFSTGMYLTADQRASVRMSWLQFEDHVFPLREMDLSTIPPDLAGIVSLLLQASDLTSEAESGLLYPSDETARGELLSAQQRLQDRVVEVSWTVAADGKIDALIVTGQLPVYEDHVRVSRADSSGQGQRYSVTSLVSEATPDQLRRAPVAYPEWVTSRYLDLPSSVTARTEALAFDIVGSAGNPYDQAKAIEIFLRENIVYDLEVGVPPEGVDIVDYLLFEQRRGFCEHYASAMTVMLRALGIPAKTVVGYFPAAYDSGAGGYLYRQENAHAWTEAWFPDYGWIRFEPTASQPASSFGDLQIDSLPTPTPTPVPTVGTPASPATAVPSPTQPEAEPELPDPVIVGSDGAGGIPWLPVGIATALGLAAIGAGAWLFMARSAGTGAQSLFASLVRWGRAGGVRPDPMSTPREYAARLGRRYPEVRPEAFEVVDAFEEYRYGNVAPTPTRVEHAAISLRQLRRRLMRSAIRRR